MVVENQQILERIAALIALEVEGFCRNGPAAQTELEAFQVAILDPVEVTVQFSGAISQQCWTVTRSNGPYRVVFMPDAGYFSLCVDGPFGPLDIGVHGKAIDCFRSV